MAYVNSGKKRGINLNPLRYWSRGVPFNNILKGGCKLIDYNNAAFIWDAGRPIATNANGYPTSLAADQQVTLLFAFDQSLNFPAGTYTWRTDGDSGWNGTTNANIDIKQFGTILNETDGEITIDWTPIDGLQYIRIVGVNPLDPMVNMRLLLPGQTAETSAFNPDYVALIADNFDVIRFMDWGNTNNSPLTLASEATPVAAITYGDTETTLPGGCPIEVMVDLCNETMCDFWHCGHDQEPASLTSSDAAYVEANLDPTLRYHREFSNETWNAPFQQRVRMDAVGIARGLDFVPSAGDTNSDTLRGNRRAHSELSQEMFDLVGAEFADPLRFVEVMGGWSGNAFNTRIVMDWPHTTTGIVPSTRGIKLAIAPYFGGPLGLDPQATDLITGPTAPNTKNTIEMTVQEVVAAAVVHSVSRYAAGGDVGEIFTDAASRGVEVVAYESGQHLVGVGAVQNNVTITQLFSDANVHADMEQAYLDALTRWGNTLNCSYNLFGAPGQKSGNWQLLEYQSQTPTSSPKWLGLKAWHDDAAAPPPTAATVSQLVSTEPTSTGFIGTDGAQFIDTGLLVSTVTVSKRTTVLDALRVVLEGIDGTGAYNYNLSVIKEIPELPNTGLLPYATLHRAEGRYRDAGGALIEKDLDVTIEAWLRFSPPGENASDAGDKMLQDIERAVESDRSLGSVVIDTTLKRNQVFTTAAGDSIAVVLVEATIKYRHPLGSP